MTKPTGKGRPSWERAHPDVSEDYIRELYEDVGFSLLQISDLTGVPKTTIYGSLKRQGVKMRKHGGTHGDKLAHEDVVKAAFMYERMGLNTTEIGEILHMSAESVGLRLRKHGVQIRSRSESLRMRFQRRPKPRGYTWEDIGRKSYRKAA